MVFSCKYLPVDVPIQWWKLPWRCNLWLFSISFSHRRFESCEFPCEVSLQQPNLVGGEWLPFLAFSHIIYWESIIIPTDELHHFSEGFFPNHQPVSVILKFFRVFHLQLVILPHFLYTFAIQRSQDELQEIILYLRDPDRFTRLGAKLPKGPDGTSEQRVFFRWGFCWGA